MKTARAYTVIASNSHMVKAAEMRRLADAVLDKVQAVRACHIPAERQRGLLELRPMVEHLRFCRLVRHNDDAMDLQTDAMSAGAQLLWQDRG